MKSKPNRILLPPKYGRAWFFYEQDAFEGLSFPHFFSSFAGVSLEGASLQIRQRRFLDLSCYPCCFDVVVSLDLY